jgi:valyl-tRNA synthetase
MIMDGLEFTEQAPFYTVYLHGLIRDEHGKKMSKTYGNVIDPLQVMDELGTDALRFTLLVGSTPGQDMSLALSKVEANRNFANKVWNAGRFTISAIGQIEGKPDAPAEWTLADSWIWARLQELIRNAERLFQTFQYGEAGRQIYEFIWSDFADWYVEIAKGQLAEGGARAYTTAQTLTRVLDVSLRLLHPFMPFVTEELWGHLRSALKDSPLEDLTGDWPEVLIIAGWPEPREPEGWEADKVSDFALIQEIVRAIRNLRAEKGVAPSKRIAASFAGGGRTVLLREQSQVLVALAGLDEPQMEIEESLAEKPEDAATLVITPVEIYLPLAGMVDLEQERARLEKELAEAESQITRLEKLLGSDFAKKAPEAVVNKEREKLAAYKETAEKIQAQL